MNLKPGSSLLILVWKLLTLKILGCQETTILGASSFLWKILDLEACFCSLTSTRSNLKTNCMSLCARLLFKYGDIWHISVFAFAPKCAFFTHKTVYFASVFCTQCFLSAFNSAHQSLQTKKNQNLEFPIVKNRFELDCAHNSEQ